MKAPLIALALMWPLWQGGRLVVQQVREAPLAPWHGRYYAFENFQIRVLVDEENRLLIVASDVLNALRIKGRGRKSERIRAIAGRDGLLTVPGIREPVFTGTGLQAWLERSSRRDVGASRCGCARRSASRIVVCWSVGWAIRMWRFIESSIKRDSPREEKQAR